MQGTPKTLDYVTNLLKEHFPFLIIVIGFFAFKYDQLFFTLFWDEPTYAIPVLTKEFDIFLDDKEIYSYTPHIPGYSLLLYLAKSIFGNSLSSLRLYSFIIFSFILLGFYKTIRLENKSKGFNLLALITFILIPINIPFSTIVLPDMTVLCVGVWTFYLYRSNQTFAYIIFSFLGSYVFETCIAFIAPIIMFELYKYLSKKTSLKDFVIYLVSPLPLIGYLIYQKIQKDMFFFHNTIIEKTTEVKSFSWFHIDEIKRIALEDTLYAIWDLAFPFLILFIPILYFSKLKDKWKVFAYFICIAFAFITFWFLFGEYHPRNMISVIAFCSLSFFLLLASMKKEIQISLLVLIIISLFTKNLNPRLTPDSYYLTYDAGHDILVKTLDYIYQKKDVEIMSYWPLRVNIYEHSQITDVNYHLRIYDVTEYPLRKIDYTFIVFDRFNDDYLRVRNFINKHDYKVEFSYKNTFYKSYYYTPID